MKVSKVACLGSGSGSKGDPMYDQMVVVGAFLARQGITVVTGAYGGAGMEAPARGASEAGGHAIGYALARSPSVPNSYLNECVPCVDFCTRLDRLLASDGFIIAAGGGAGSFLELAAINLHNQKVWKKEPKRTAILLPGPKYVEYEGWGAYMLDSMVRWGVLDMEQRCLVNVVCNPIDAVAWITGK